jgi:hypothetical protein
MTDATQDGLDRNVDEAKARLMATLDVLDVRTRSLVHEATDTARNTAWGVAGVLALSLGLALAERASRRVSRRVTQRQLRDRVSPNGSLLGDTIRVGAVAVLFISVSAWAKHAAEPDASRRAGQPQLRRVATLLSAVLGKGPHAVAQRSGTTRAFLPSTTIATTPMTQPHESSHSHD